VLPPPLVVLVVTELLVVVELDPVVGVPPVPEAVPVLVLVPVSPPPPFDELPNADVSPSAQAPMPMPRRPRITKVVLAYFTSLWSETTRMPGRAQSLRRAF